MLDTSTLSRDSNNLGGGGNLEDIPSYKVLVIGDQDIGKTSLIYRYLTNEFMENNRNTIGIDFKEKIVQVAPGKKIILMIWDTAGSEKFRSIAHSYFTNCDGIILCFDTTNKKTFENLNGWVNYINEYIKIKDNDCENTKDKSNKNKHKSEEEEEDEEEIEEEENEWIEDDQSKPVILLAGTKCDLKNDQNVSIEERRKFIKTIKCEYFETSSKEGEGVEDLFFYMAKELFDKKIMINQNKNGFKLRNEKNRDESLCHSKASCC